MIVRAPVLWLLHAMHLRGATTQTTDAELACLARHARGRTMLVEIGVMHGASTRVLCDAMEPSATLVAIDPFPAGRLGVSFERRIARREVRRGSRRQVIWRRQRSEVVAATWSDAVDFLFVDGDHSWRGIERDWTMWSPFVRAGGVVLLHDSREVPGRTSHDSVRYTADVILNDPGFACVESIDSLTVLQRRTEKDRA